MRQAIRALSGGLLDEMRAEGIAVHDLTPDQRAQWVALTRPAVQDIIEAVGGDAQLLYQTILEGKVAFKKANSPQ